MSSKKPNNNNNSLDDEGFQEVRRKGKKNFKKQQAPVEVGNTKLWGGISAEEWQDWYSLMMWKYKIYPCTQPPTYYHNFHECLGNHMHLNCPDVRHIPNELCKCRQVGSTDSRGNCEHYKQYEWLYHPQNYKTKQCKNDKCKRGAKWCASFHPNEEPGPDNSTREPPKKLASRASKTTNSVDSSSDNNASSPDLGSTTNSENNLPSDEQGLKANNENNKKINNNNNNSNNNNNNGNPLNTGLLSTPIVAATSNINIQPPKVDHKPLISPLTETKPKSVIHNTNNSSPSISNTSRINDPKIAPVGSKILKSSTRVSPTSALSTQASAAKPQPWAAIAAPHKKSNSITWGESEIQNIPYQPTSSTRQIRTGSVEHGPKPFSPHWHSVESEVSSTTTSGEHSLWGTSSQGESISSNPFTPFIAPPSSDPFLSITNSIAPTATSSVFDQSPWGGVISTNTSSRNSPTSSLNNSENPRTLESVLKENGLSQGAIDVLIDQNVGLEDLPDISEDFCNQFGLKWGDKNKLLKLAKTFTL